MAYFDFITKFIDVINSLCPSKKIRIKGNTKISFHAEIISKVYKCDACYKKFRLSELETDKIIFRATIPILKITIQTKKGCFFKISYKKI